MDESRTQPDDVDEPIMWFCSSCHSWTDERVPYGDLVDPNGWSWIADPDHNLYCPECQ